MNSVPIVSKKQRYLITLCVMAATVMQVLDTTIVNVALPNMQGSFSAAPDQISWILTSYLIASAIFMPLTGYFTDRLGRKKFLLMSILGFTIASVLCGLSLTLDQMVVFRLLQGIFGAALVPLSQAIMFDTYPIEERGKAMTIWGMGIMIGPILGPTLGGYLTEVLNWRWTFYINVPFGLLSFLLALQTVPDTEKKERKLDWPSLIGIATAIGMIQYILDRGNQEDWFESSSIKIATLLAIGGFVSYVFLSFFRKNTKPVFDVRLFQDRNFVTSSIMMTAMGLGMFGSMVLQPLMLQNLFDYPTFTTGLVIAPRGVSSMLGMMIAGKFASRIHPRTFITLGIFLNIIATYIGTFYNLSLSPAWIVGPCFIQGLGLGFVMMPLSSLALSTLPRPLIPEGAGLFSLMRTFGFSIGISAVLTVFARHTQIAWNQIGGFLQPFNPAVIAYLQPLHLKPTDAEAAALFAMEVGRQAQMVAIVDVYMVITWSFILMLPLAYLLKDKRKELLTNN